VQGEHANVAILVDRHAQQQRQRPQIRNPEPETVRRPIDDVRQRQRAPTGVASRPIAERFSRRDVLRRDEVTASYNGDRHVVIDLKTMKSHPYFGCQAMLLVVTFLIDERERSCYSLIRVGCQFEVVRFESLPRVEVGQHVYLLRFFSTLVVRTRRAIRRVAGGNKTGRSAAAER